MPSSFGVIGDPKATEPLLMTITAKNHPMFDDMRIDILAREKYIARPVRKVRHYDPTVDEELE